GRHAARGDERLGRRRRGAGQAGPAAQVRRTVRSAALRGDWRRRLRGRRGRNPRSQRAVDRARRAGGADAWRGRRSSVRHAVVNFLDEPAMIAKDIKNGMVLNYNGAPCIIESISVQSPSARGAATLYKYRARNLVTKQKIDITLRGGE